MSTARCSVSRRIRLSRLEWHYLDWPAVGNDHGPTMLLVHPDRSSAEVWRPFVAASRLPIRMFAPDLRGHGGTAWPDGGYRVEEVVADLHDLVDAVDLAPLVLVGGAIGAIGAPLYATHHPDEMVGVVASDTAFAIDRALLRDLQEQIRTQLDYMDDDARGLFVDAMFEPTADGRTRWRYHPPGVAAMMDPLDPPLTEVLDVRCPALLLRGSESKPLGRPDLQRLAACIPGARVAEVPNADHLLSLDNPHDYAAIVDEWVEEEVIQ